MNPFLHKKAKDMKKRQTGSDDKNDEKPKRDNKNSNAVMCTTADKKVSIYLTWRMLLCVVLNV